MFTDYRQTYIRLVASESQQDTGIRPAATVVVVRDGPGGAEVLMVRRNQSAVFLGGAHVFPGGALEDVDSTDLARRVVDWSGGPEELPWRAAALRELAEEAGVMIGTDLDPPGVEGGELYAALEVAGESFDADVLEYFGNWVTPLGAPRRYDTRFYAVQAGGRVLTDDREVFDAEWVRPEAALDAADAGEWYLEVPTRATLESFVGHESASSFVEQARRMPVRRIAPRLGVGSDGTRRILFDGDPGYEDAPA